MDSSIKSPSKAGERRFLITGGAGFFGGVLKRALLEAGQSCVSIDLQPDADSHPQLTSIQGDLRDSTLVEQTFSAHRFKGVFHCAAILAHGSHVDEDLLWSSNVDATQILAEACRRHGVRKLIFTSTNCLWAENLHRAIAEDEPPHPAEVYGRSKLEGEKVLAKYAGDLDVIVLRCPTIIDTGRLGLLAILFEFIQDNKRVWVVGSGENRYQFIYAGDLVKACVLAAESGCGSQLLHIGSDNVQSLRQVYQHVIDAAGSKSRIASLPKGPTITAMKLAHKLKISPLGPYHYKMIAEDFLFDTSRIKNTLGWAPTLTNEQMLERAYAYYAQNRSEISQRRTVSAHRKPTPMGVIRVLKWIS